MRLARRTLSKSIPKPGTGKIHKEKPHCSPQCGFFSSSGILSLEKLTNLYYFQVAAGLPHRLLWQIRQTGLVILLSALWIQPTDGWAMRVLSLLRYWNLPAIVYPVGAVICGGRPTVRIGSRKANFGMINAEPKPFFVSFSRSERIERYVTSEPVPAVVGIAIIGSPGLEACPLRYNS